MLTDVLDLSPKIALFNGNIYLTELQRIFFGASSNEINNNKTKVIAGHFSRLLLRAASIINNKNPFMGVKNIP